MTARRNKGQQPAAATIMNSNLEVSVEVAPTIPSLACTCTKPELMSYDNSWVGQGNGSDGLLVNEYKGANSCLDLSQSKKKNQARASHWIKAKLKQKRSGEVALE